MENITNNICKVKTEPAAEPVTAQELYDHLNLNAGLANVQTQLNAFITAARQQFEFATDGRIAIATVFYQYLTDWCDPIRLYRGAVTSVASVTYTDEDEQVQTLSHSSDLTGIPALVWAEEYPSISSTKLRPIVVEYTAGWADAAAVPADIKLAIKLLAGHWYETREAYAEDDLREVPMGFQRICDKYRTGMKGW